MRKSRTLALVVLLSIFVARSHTRGEDQNISVGSNLTQHSQTSVTDILEDFKAEIFVEGSDAVLRCDSSHVKWNELIYIVWNISLQGRKCFISSSPTSQDYNTCGDGKKLHNSSDGVSLFIPNITKKDEGSYKCDISYEGGSYYKTVNVSVNVLSTGLEFKGDHWVATCEATYLSDQLQPTLQWEPALNITYNTSVKNGDSSFIVESQLILPKNIRISNLTCVATYTSGKELQRKTLHFSNIDFSHSSNPSNIVVITVSSICLILLSLALIYMLRRKLQNLSLLKMLCCKSKISTQLEDKPPQNVPMCIKPPDVEEVEPYASYVQRVNSIYNSSAELFNA